MDPELTMSQPPTSAHAPSFFSKYKFTLISLLILILAIVPLAFLSRQQKKVEITPSQTVSNPTPTVVPFTSDNAEPTIDATDQNIQTALQQADTDVNAAAAVDSSQDNVTGL